MRFEIAACIGLCALALPGVAQTGRRSPTESSYRMATTDIYWKWTGPYGGVPPFDKVKIPGLRSALDSGIAQALANVDAIATQTAPATFENTIAALERADEALENTESIYGVWRSNMSSDEFRPVQAEMEPKLAAYRDKLLQNGPLFRRIETVYQNAAKLNPEQQRLTWDIYTNFVRAGAKLTDEKKKRIAEINQRLAALYNKFSNNLLHDEENYVLYLKKEQLGGLAPSFVASAVAAAKQRGHDGEYAILNTRSSVEPFLTDSTERALREKVWRTFYSRGDNGDEYDNNAVITEILKLRAERTTLQGYKTFADRAIEKQVAKTPAAAMDLMMKLWPAAIARVKEEVADMQAIADREGARIKIAPWDYRFYAEKVRKAKYDLDSSEVMQYLQLEKLREGMMWAAGKAYGFEFVPLTNIPVFHEDVRVWEVKRGGKHVGVWYFDPYARKGKRSGAWMTAYRKQSRMDGEVTTLVSNNSNFVKGAPGEPVLISWTDAETMFHEFGHAIHGLSSNVTYPTLSGTSVARDYVEFPSQINEYFLSAPEVLNRFAVHYKTGKPMPAELLKKIKNADKFNQGFATTEFLASALVDMKVHTIANPDGIDPDKFERETLAALNMPDELPMRHRMPQFAHIFSGEGYAAGYYSYLWADALTADAWEAFQEGKGAFDQKVAMSFYDNVLSKGNTIDPAIGYRKFRGRDVDTNALMRDRGFPVK
ncbi:MAG: M3 family metallopeptidase [Acidobacteria bacterium]|nr:M3 family metallopeptidase [Acidobacteriota bacterium]